MIRNDTIKLPHIDLFVLYFGVDSQTEWMVGLDNF